MNCPVRRWQSVRAVPPVSAISVVVSAQADAQWFGILDGVQLSPRRGATRDRKPPMEKSRKAGDQHRPPQPNTLISRHAAGFLFAPIHTANHLPSYRVGEAHPYTTTQHPLK
ncbi:hypothetical protein ACXG8O_004032 [Citrobacter youngae]